MSTEDDIRKAALSYVLELLQDDRFAMGFQTLGQYRKAVLDATERFVDRMTEEA